ncbi:MAG: PEGA domain-containing protein, partial [Acidobacteriota bacterium]
VDRRSDVFSLGIILYEISTQHRCFRADSDFDTMHRIVTGDVVRPTRLVPNYPPALEAIVMKALAVDPNQRYQTSGQLLEAIESFAVQARMSLSTMGLGRFMRDMFGEVQEPWLASAARGSQPMMQHKESTISSTDGRSDVAKVQPGLLAAVARDDDDDDEADGIPDEEARFPDSSKSEAARTILDLPRGNNDATVAEDDEPQPEWNARSYPPSQPAAGASAPLPPELVPTGPYTKNAAMQAQHAPLAQAPAGTTPPPMPHATPQPMSAVQVPANAFAHSPSSSSSRPAISAQPIPSTKHGYASGGGMTAADLGYPRYEAQPASEVADELSLKPNRKPLIIGIVCAVIGFAIVLVVKLGSGGSSEAKVVAQTGSDETEPAPAAPAPTPESAGSAQTAGSDTMADDMISVRVVSHPPGAEVIVAGAKIGVTPLDTKLHRGTTFTELTVHMEGYVDVTSKIDLGGDFSKDVTLKTPAEAAEQAAQAPAPGSGSASGPGSGSGSAEPKVEDHKPTHGNEHKATNSTTPTHHESSTTPRNTSSGERETHEAHETHETHETHRAPPPPKPPKCQPPGPNLDPFMPVCKPGEKP